MENKVNNSRLISLKDTRTQMTCVNPDHIKVGVLLGSPNRTCSLSASTSFLNYTINANQLFIELNLLNHLQSNQMIYVGWDIR